MLTYPPKEAYAALYYGTPPWETGRVQPALAPLLDHALGPVLDVGCGTGTVAVHLAQQGHEVRGIDYLPRPIELARRRAAEAGVTVNFEVRDACDVGLLAQRFNTVVDCTLFHSFSDEDRGRYAAAIARVLNPGGRLLLLCISDREPPDEGPRRVSEQELRETFCGPWRFLSLSACQLEVVPHPGIRFSPGGPHAWMAELERLADPDGHISRQVFCESFSFDKKISRD
jgi:SAM-dependent methyltransferase